MADDVRLNMRLYQSILKIVVKKKKKQYLNIKLVYLLLVKLFIFLYDDVIKRSFGNQVEMNHFYTRMNSPSISRIYQLRKLNRLSAPISTIFFTFAITDKNKK